LPKKATKHIPKHQAPIGTIRGQKRKVLDGETQKESWRQGSKGFARDWDGDPIARNYNRSKMKNKPHHSPHSGKRKEPEYNPED